ncbi:hypothetical protein [Reyranella sp.]|uniref:hypothetical protein n=1 Tax=Reyranella sp. TaxID=1929291 RepID=UPI003D11BF93
MTRSVPVLLVVLLVGACGIPGHQVAKEGRRTIVGMNADAVQSCAGIPTRTKRLDRRTEIFSYERTNENIGGIQVNIPIIGGGFKVSGTGSYCHAIMRVVDGKVAELNYTGDNDDQAGRESVCAPIVRGCVRAHDNDPESKTAQGR